VTTPVEAFLTLKGQQVSFRGQVKYLDVIFYKKIRWKLHIQMINTKALQIFTSIYPLLKSEPLSIGMKLIFYKALIRSIVTYACPAWEFKADTYLLKL
jgi:hypothetical protein